MTIAIIAVAYVLIVLSLIRLVHVLHVQEDRMRRGTEAEEKADSELAKNLGAKP